MSGLEITTTPGQPVNSANMTILDVLAHWVKKQPNKVLYRFLSNGEEETDKIDYKTFYKRQLALAHLLNEKGEKGDRVLLLYPTGIEYIIAFFACLSAGMIAVPVYPPAGSRRLGRLENIVADCNAQWALSTEALKSKGEQWFLKSDSLQNVKWIATDGIQEAIVPGRLQEVIASDTAFLQYTSGSTGNPKGVVVSHANLIHNEGLIKASFDHSHETIVVGWLPVYHDMGLIGNIIQPLFVGGTLIFMPPTAFIQKPIRWIQALSSYKATTGGAPNFAYDLCVTAIGDEALEGIDLSHWKIAYNGAETIRPNTIRRFVEKFKKVGFRETAYFPCYGMAETTLIITGTTGKSKPSYLSLNKTIFDTGKVKEISKTQDTQTFNSYEIVGSGRVLKDMDVRIVNPTTLVACAKNEVGEIWVSGPSVAQKYWNKPVVSKATFKAQCTRKGKQDSTPFLRTGDLGFLRRGILYVTGRIKELIIINGANHYPQDIEQTVQAASEHFTPNAGAVFSIQAQQKEVLVVAQEIKRTSLKAYDLETLIKAVKEAVLKNHQLAVKAIVLVSPGRIPKTSSGKIKRLQCAEWYMSNTFVGVLDQFEAVKQSITGADHKSIELKDANHLEEWMISTLAKTLQLPSKDIIPTTAFAELGLSSLQAIRLAGELSEYTGKEIQPITLYDYSNVKNLSQYILHGETPTSVEGVSEAGDEPIAIISMACRFPGADDLEEFWGNLTNKVDSVTEVPSKRWSNDIYFSALPKKNKISSKHGGFIEDIDLFDAHFFGIHEREASQMDPQQRILLEQSHVLFENCGYLPENLKGSDTGIFLGISQSNYSDLIKMAEQDIYSGLGGALSIAANRLSYHYDFTGPSIAIDTACSSSLVAVHNAILSLRNGECGLAIAGGVNIVLSPEVSVALSQANMLSPNGRCKTFDDSADGYVRSEGCGLVLLKPLKMAMAEGDTIVGVIKGSAINQDGHSNGLTAPNGLAQQAVIKKAIAKAGITADTVGYVEAHGTGTALGDPIEVNALQAVYGSHRRKTPLAIGSVKANIGHLESAAGIAGLIKLALCLRYRKIPGQPHFNKKNHHIPWEHINLQVNAELRNWEAQENKVLIGAVSSFGFGGVNAHLILEELPKGYVSEPSSRNNKRNFHLVPTAAKSIAALEQMKKRLVAIKNTEKHTLHDIAFSQAIFRSAYSYRGVAVIPASNTHLTTDLFLDHEIKARLVGGEVLKTAFLFAGQGSQYVGMGMGLYNTEAVFKYHLDACIHLLNPLLQIDLLKLLKGEEMEGADLNNTKFTQPAIFALEYALGKLWIAWGVVPEVLMGHSIGEIAAACLAGVFSLEDAVKLVFARGSMMQSLPKGGMMVAFSCTENEAVKAIESFDLVSLAAVNTTNQVVVSGGQNQVETLVKVLAKQGVTAKHLQVSHAFHSPLMLPMLNAFEELLAQLVFNKPNYRLVSTVTGEEVTNEMSDKAYWLSHITATVHFKKGLERLHKHACNTFIEIGPQATLLGLVATADSRISKTSLLLPSLQRNRTDGYPILNSLGKYYLSGGRVDWNGFYKENKGRFVPLPTYPFDRKRYWLKLDKGLRKETAFSNHRMLSSEVDFKDCHGAFETMISTDLFPYLEDYKVNNRMPLPAVFFLELLQTGIADFLPKEKPYKLESFEQEFPIVLKKDAVFTLQVKIKKSEDKFLMEVFVMKVSDNQSKWARCAWGKVGEDNTTQLPEMFDAEQVRTNLKAIDLQNFYNTIASHGIQYGSMFQGVTEAFEEGDVVYAYIEGTANTQKEAANYKLHPVLLENCLQLLFAGQSEEWRLLFPNKFIGYKLYQKGASGLWVKVKYCESGNPGTKPASIALSIWDTEGKAVASIDSVVLSELQDVRGVTNKVAATPVMYQLQQQPILLGETSKPPLPLTWLILGAKNEKNSLEAQFQDLGNKVIAFEYLNDLYQYKDFSSIDGIVVLWPNMGRKTVDNGAEDTCITALKQLQFIVSQKNKGVCKNLKHLWWVTKDVYGTGHETGLIHGGLWGLGRVFMQEMRQFDFGIIDTVSKNTKTSLLARICSGAAGKERQLVIDGRSCNALRFTVINQSGLAIGDKQHNAIPHIRLSTGTVLITGGVGQLGQEVTNWLLSEDTKIAQVLLVGRRKRDATITKILAGLSAKSMPVYYVSTDVSEFENLEKSIAPYLKEFPLTGVFHLAGVLEDAVLENQTEEKFLKAFAPKVRGAWNLHKLSEKMPLDFFITFSSIASVMGSSGQANYAAANAFLDTLATFRRTKGLKAQNINWGPWELIGLGGVLELDRQRMASIGINSWKTTTGLSVLEAISKTSHTNTIAVSLNSIKFASYLATNLEGIPTTYQDFLNTQLAGQRASDSSLKEQLAALAPTARVSYLERFLQKEVAKVLSEKEATSIATSRPLMEAGLDSLMAVELRNRISSAVGKILPVSLLFDYPTIETCAVHLYETYLGGTDHAPKTNEETVVSRKQTSDEKFAIVGYSGRFPGAENLKMFWSNLVEGVDGISEIPKERWPLDEWYSDDKEAEGKMYVRHGGFLKNIESFDASFFGISPREAISIDPQQRLLLETSWEALEHAGYTKQDVENSNTGVYFGMCGIDYQAKVMSDAKQIDAYAMLGSSHSAIAGRISYWLGLKGPCMAIDTACSSSLVSVHLGIQALRNGECDQVLAGGVNLVLSPQGSVYFSKLNALSSTGHCHSFDANADGYIRSEGCGVVLIKRLSDALSNGDQIHAIIRGSAVNQDGKSQGFTAPNGPSQQAVIRRALEQSKVNASEIDYVEAHGTGTPLGDPIELQSLGTVFSKKGEQGTPLLVGSVKSNIGHCEGAAGIAGLLKAVLAMKHQLIPGNIHFNTPSPHIPWETLPLKITGSNTVWAKNGKPRMAGVSSFGFSGTNAHLILEEGINVETESVASRRTKTSELLIVSAHNEQALAGQIRNLLTYIDNEKELNIADIAYSLAVHRTHFSHRVAFRSSQLSSVKQTLKNWNGFQKPSKEELKIAFVFTGQGSQYATMGRELYETEPEFRYHLEACLERFNKNLEIDLKEVIFHIQNTTYLNETLYTQPALFSLGYALAKLWISWGIRPSVLMGHSIGEITAACIAGVFDLDDAVKLVTARARLMQALTKEGTMASLRCNAEVAQELLKNHLKKVVIAAKNSTDQTVISGERSAVEAICKAVKEKGITYKLLEVSHAFHSPLMQPILNDFEKAAKKVSYEKPLYPLIGNISGKPVQEEILMPEYWVEHVIATVDFLEGVRTTQEMGINCYWEIGPQPTLTAMISQIVEEDGELLFGGFLRKNQSDGEMVLESLSKCYVSGLQVDWKSFYQHRQGMKLNLPSYAFQRKRYWIDATVEAAPKTAGHTKSPFLSSKLSLAQSDHAYETHISLNRFPYLEQHKVGDKIVLPAAAFFEIVQEFIRELKQEDLYIGSMRFHTPLALDSSKGVMIQFIGDSDEAQLDFNIYGKPDQGTKWEKHASGAIAQRTSIENNADFDLAGLKTTPSTTTIPLFYTQLAAVGLHYGSIFQGVKELYEIDNGILARVSLSEEEATSSYVLHPAILDGAFQAAALMYDTSGSNTLYLPDSMQAYHIEVSGENELWVRLQHKSGSVGDTTLSFSMSLANSLGKIIGGLGEVVLRKMPLNLFIDSTKGQEVTSRFQLGWEELAPLETNVSNDAGKSWALISYNTTEDNDSLTKELTNAGDTLLEIESWENLANIASQEQLTGVIVDWRTKEVDFTIENFEERSIAALRQLQSWISSSQQKSMMGLEAVWWLTDDTFGIADKGVGLANSPLQGLARVFSQEYYHLPLRVVSIAEETPLSALRSLLRAPNINVGERHITLRNDALFGMRLRPLRKPIGIIENKIESEKLKGTVLVTGGLGSIGLGLADWLVANTAVEHLLLVGRSAASLEANRAMENLRAKGVKVTYERADVSRKNQLATAIENIPEQYALKGVFHLAGVLQDATIINQTKNHFEKALRPKASGAWHLHELTKDSELDYFVLFSSFTSILGSIGQANYATANSFLDALAGYRRNLSLPIHVINWGAWDISGGMAATTGTEEADRIRALGLEYLEKEEAFEYLSGVLNSNEYQHVITGIVEERFTSVMHQRLGAVPLLYEDFSVDLLQTDTSEGDAFHKELQLLSKESRHGFLKETIQAEIGKVMSFGNDHASLPTDRPLMELGMDSLMAMELRNRFQQLRIEIGIEKILDGASIEELAAETMTIIEKKSEVATKEVAIVPLKEQAYYPVSPSQKSLWILENMGLDASAYNMISSHAIKGDLRINALKKACLELVNRHEVLRTTYRIVNAQTKQKVNQLTDFKEEQLFELIDFRSYKIQPEVVKKKSEEIANRFFDLEKGPMIRMTLLQLSDTGFVLILVIHHMACDAWSHGVVLHEIRALYQNYAHEKPHGLPVMKVHFKEYVSWLNNHLTKDKLEKHLTYWKQQFVKEYQPLQLKTDFPRTDVRSHAGAKETIVVSPKNYDALKEFSKQAGVSPFITILAVIKVLLYRHSGQEDITVGSPVAGRDHKAFEHQIGYYSNVIVLRDIFTRTTTFKAFLQQVKNTTLAGLEHQRVPYDMLVDTLSISPEEGRNPLYDVLVTLVTLGNITSDKNINDKAFFSGLELGDGVRMKPYELEHKTSKLDLTFFIMQGARLEIEIEYRLDLFKTETISEMVRDFSWLLNRVLKAPGKSIQQLKSELSSDAETNEHQDHKKALKKELKEDF